MDMGDLRGVSTILCMLAFGAVVYWAYGPSRKADFQEAAEILFDEPDSDSGKELKK
jgi:cytochrome c oxidase cbb3-type subunit 4